MTGILPNWGRASEDGCRFIDKILYTTDLSIHNNPLIYAYWIGDVGSGETDCEEMYNFGKSAS